MRFRVKIPEIFLSLVFSIIAIFGYSFKTTNSSNLVFLYPIRFLILFFIYLILFFIIIIYLEKKLLSYEKNTSSKICDFIFNKHLFLIPIIIIICWLPYIIIKYPGTPGWDFYYFLNGYYEYDSTLTHHFPLIYVYMCMYFIEFGVLINNVNFGLFLLTLFHASIMIISFSVVFKYLKKWNVSYRIRWFILLFYSLMPLFGNYATTIYHDIIYSSLILLYVLLLTDVVSDNFLVIKKYIMIGILSLLLCLTRKNGVFIVLPTNFYIIYKYLSKKNCREKLVKIFCCVIPIILFCFSNYLFSLKYIKTSYLEAMSIPIQSIARYSKYYNNDITEEEKEAINGVIDYDYAGIVYNPTIVDKTRNNYGNYNATGDEIIDFFKVWVKLFFRHPDSYIEAVVNTNYPLYYPFVNVTYTFFEVKSWDYDTYLDFDGPNALSEIRYKLRDINNKFETIPLLQYINDPGVYVWLLFFLIMLLFKKKKDLWLPLIPMIMTFACCLNAPTIDYNTRYVFPIIFSIFPLLAFCSQKIK